VPVTDVNLPIRVLVYPFALPHGLVLLHFLQVEHLADVAAHAGPGSSQVTIPEPLVGYHGVGSIPIEVWFVTVETDVLASHGDLWLEEGCDIVGVFGDGLLQVQLHFRLLLPLLRLVVPIPKRIDDQQIQKLVERLVALDPIEQTLEGEPLPLLNFEQVLDDVDQVEGVLAVALADEGVQLVEVDGAVAVVVDVAEVLHFHHGEDNHAEGVGVGDPAAAVALVAFLER